MSTRAQSFTINYSELQHNVSQKHCQHTPGQKLHGRIFYNIVHRKLGLQLKISWVLTTDFAYELFWRTQFLYDKTKKNVMQSYMGYKNYWDNKNKSLSLSGKSLLLNFTN